MVGSYTITLARTGGYTVFLPTRTGNPPRPHSSGPQCSPLTRARITCPNTKP